MEKYRGSEMGSVGTDTVVRPHRPGDLSFIPRTHISVKEESQIFKAVLQPPHMPHSIRVPVLTLTLVNNNSRNNNNTKLERRLSR